MKTKEKTAEQQIRNQIRNICLRFFYWWYNVPGSNTEQDYDDWAKGEGEPLIKKLSALQADPEKRDAATYYQGCQDTFNNHVKPLLAKQLELQDKLKSIEEIKSEVRRFMDFEKEVSGSKHPTERYLGYRHVLKYIEGPSTIVEPSPAKEVEKPDFEPNFELMAELLVPYRWSEEDDPDGNRTQHFVEDFCEGAQKIWDQYVSPLQARVKELEQVKSELVKNEIRLVHSHSNVLEEWQQECAGLRFKIQSLEAENEELRKTLKELLPMAEDGQALRRRNNILVECLTEGDEQIRRARSLLATSPI